MIIQNSCLIVHYKLPKLKEKRVYKKVEGQGTLQKGSKQKTKVKIHILSKGGADQRKEALLLKKGFAQDQDQNQNLLRNKTKAKNKFWIKAKYLKFFSQRPNSKNLSSSSNSHKKTLKKQ